MAATGTGTAGRASGLGPLQIESTPSLVAARIRAGIFDGAFRPDAQLNEVELASELGVSRGPIREAFQRLIHEGLLRAERNRGVFVVALDSSSIPDVYFVRDVIERAAALQLAAQHDGEGLAKLEKVLRAMDLAADSNWPDLVAIDLEFHQSLVASTGSLRLARAFEPIYAETRLYLSYLEPHYERRRDVVDEHRAIFEAIRSGQDPGLIERLVHEHMTDGAEQLIAHELR